MIITAKQYWTRNEIEDIIKQYYIVDYNTIDDEHIEVIRI